MKIKNIFQAQRKTVSAVHSGKGEIEFCRVFSSEDFQTGIDFVDYAVIPPGCSIGFHQHSGNEEFYLILDGKGRMFVGDEEMYVEKGDLIINPDKSFHGLENCSNDKIQIFVVQVSNSSYTDQKTVSHFK